MALNTVTLKWDLADLIQSGLSAVLSITPTAQMSDSTDHVLIPPVARTYAFSGGAGQLTGIVANDNSSILPAGTGYLISVTAENGQVIVPQFQTQLLYANGAVQWLDALAVVPAVTTSYQYLPLPSGTATEGYVPVATGSGEASTWAVPPGSSLPLTTLGDILYEDATPAPARLAGNTAATRKFLRQAGTGTASAAPAWDTLQAADIPNLSASYDTAGSAATVQAASLQKSANLSDVASAPTARTNLGLGSAATQNSSAFDAAGAAAAAQAAAQAASVPLAGGTMTGALMPAVVTLTDAATVAVNAALGNDFRLTFTSAVGSSRSIGAPSNPADGQDIVITLIQAASGGPYTVSWNAAFDFGTAGAPVLATTASAGDMVGFKYHASASGGNNKWWCTGSATGF